MRLCRPARSELGNQVLPLEKALWGGVPWGLRAELERLLPQQVPIPTGRLARVDYGWADSSWR